MKHYYFNKYEQRIPYSPVKNNKTQMFIFHCSVILTVFFGLLYFYWRWTRSINYDSPVFSLILIFAETFSFIGLVLLMFDLWSNKDFEQHAPPHFLSDIGADTKQGDRPVKIDVFIATINEEAELLRYSIRDAKAMEYPFRDVPVKIYLLDDGRRDGRDSGKENIKQLCDDENIFYLTRENNIGYKAGNLKNGLENSDGDIFIILDADSRPFKNFLKNTLGYFRKHNVAWVQTCHWFYDTTPAITLDKYISHTFGIRSLMLRKALRKLTGKISTGEDIYGSDPRHFYEVIQRRRNFHNASFCCGAGSVHRRDAVMSTARHQYNITLDKLVKRALKNNRRKSPSPEEIKAEIISNLVITPFKYHISEDLYTSIIIQSDMPNKWESVLHPYVECKLLSPQDIDSYVKQRSRYAEGSIDIFINDNPLFRRGLSWRQKICYFHSVWCYFSCLWLLVFLLSPITYFFTNVMPVSCSTAEFFIFFLPFFIFSKIADEAGSWGISQKRGRQYYVCLFWINLLSILHVLSGKKINFKVTPKSRQKAHPFKYVWPHVTIIGLTLTGVAMGAFDIINGRGVSLGYCINTFWGLYNCYMLNVFVRAAYWDTEAMADETGVPGQILQREVIKV